MMITVSFFTNPFQERGTSESAELISSTFKKNESEVELEISNYRRYLSLKTRENGTNF
jgi:hypothetical protein